jgi:hypothetical protein
MLLASNGFQWSSRRRAYRDRSHHPGRGLHVEESNWLHPGEARRLHPESSCCEHFEESGEFWCRKAGMEEGVERIEAVVVQLTFVRSERRNLLARASSALHRTTAGPDNFTSPTSPTLSHYLLNCTSRTTYTSLTMADDERETKPFKFVTGKCPGSSHAEL